MADCLIFPTHARERIRARCPDIRLPVARREVFDAIRNGRVSARKPERFDANGWGGGPPDARRLRRYCWNGTGSRCWVLAGVKSKGGGRQWIVLTVLTPLTAGVS